MSSRQRPTVALVDYEMGNLRSVSKALEKVGCRVRWAASPSGLKNAAALVLPGVGSFEVAMKNLNKRRLTEPLRKWVTAGKPFLGICLGYQLLFETSEEGNGKTRGLGIYRGKVRKFPIRKNLKVPQIGWNTVHLNASNRSEALKDLIQDEPHFYFVHSYFPDPQSRDIVATTTDYGVRFASSICVGSLFASQFHPEKSGANGLALLRNFVRRIAA